jgi:hypothetical protein
MTVQEKPYPVVSLMIDTFGEWLKHRSEPLVLHDMERVCSLCNHKRQCDRDLATGIAAAHYQEYCGNADTIEGLGQRVSS